MPTTISYNITCCNETDTLRQLLMTVVLHVTPEDEIVVVIDKDNHSKETEQIVLDYQKSNNREGNFKVFYNSLNKNYAEHKNSGIEQCSKTFIFQIDGDELPATTLLGESLRELLESNPNIELFWVPRVNIFKGVTQEDANKWRWKLDNSPTYNALRVNFPDFQGRILKKDYPRIKWSGKLHERITGYKEYSFLPAEEEWALYHDKTIETQIATNLRYNKEFSKSENEGHTIK
jgi:glycosyltransferase involved in cell wall biosynthesis